MLDQSRIMDSLNSELSTSISEGAFTGTVLNYQSQQEGEKVEFSVKSGSSKAKSLTIPLDKKKIQIGPIKVAVYSLIMNYLRDVLFVQIERKCTMICVILTTSSQTKFVTSLLTL